MPINDYIPDDSPIASGLNTILQIFKDPAKAAQQAMSGASQAVGQFEKDVSTATKPGMVDDLIGFFKSKATAYPGGGEADESTPTVDKILNIVGNATDLLYDPENPAGSITSMAPIAKLAKASSEVAPIINKMETIVSKGRPIAKAASPSLEALSSGDRMAMEFALTREVPAIDILADKAGGGPLAEMSLMDKQKTMNTWRKAVKQSNVPLPITPPDPPDFTTGNVTFQSRDEGIRDVFGTPASVAVRTGNLDAYKAMSEIQLTEASVKRRIVQRNLEDNQWLSRITPEAANTTAEVMRGVKLDEALTKMKPAEQQVAIYLRDKFDADRKLIQARLRDLVRPSIEREVRKAAGEEVELLNNNPQGTFSAIIERDLGTRIDKAVKERVPDSWGINEYLPEIFPGEYLIKDRKGSVLGSARTKFEAKLQIRDLVEQSGGKLGADQLAVTNKSFVDADLLRDYRRSPASFVRELTNAAGLTSEEISKAAIGDLGAFGQNKFWSNLLKRGKSPGFTKDIGVAMDIYNRGIERWIQLTDMSNKVQPVVSELKIKGFPVMANTIDENIKALWGYRSELGQRFDNELQRMPIIRDLVAPYALERWMGAMKTGMVKTMIQLNPKFHIVNSAQLFTTLWPIAGADEISHAIRMFDTSAGKELLNNFGLNIASKVESKLGPIEDFNQGVAFITMYNRGVKYGLDAKQAADYAFLRGNIYSQFHSLTTDRPGIFRKLDPVGALTTFQRFSVKQIEQMADLVKDRNLNGAAKWLSTVAIMGGTRALTFGGAGFLGYEMYQKVKDSLGESAADVLHYGLPALAGVDLSNTAMVYNPPFGASLAERVGNIALGPMGGIATSVATAAFNNKAIDPSVSRRVLNATIQRLPVLRELDALKRMMIHDYDMKDVSGKLKYKADTLDLIKISLGFRPLGKLEPNNATFAKAEQLADWMTSAKEKRDGVLDYAAARYGQAKLSGMGLPKELEDAIRKDVEGWNSRWPEMPITGTDIMSRAQSKAKQASMNFQQRLMNAGGKKVANQFKQDER